MAYSDLLAELYGNWDRVFITEAEFLDALPRLMREHEKTRRTTESVRREPYVLAARYGLGGRDSQTLKQIGEEYKISTERVRQILSRSMRKLRHCSGAAYVARRSGEKFVPFREMVEWS